MSRDNPIFEPRYDASCGAAAEADEPRRAGLRITTYLADCADDARRAFADEPACDRPPPGGATDAIIDVLLHRDFNHQSKGRVAHLLPEVRQRIGAHVARGTPVQLFMSYNGGYHATIRPDLSGPLGFAASTAELLFLCMIARLRRRLRAVHPPGMIYHIVLNNGVAHYVNDIALARTEAYARELQAMVAELGGAADVRVLVQSHLGDFAQRMRAEAPPPAPAIDAAMHRNIERFLGRSCTEAEARMRLGRYAPAEAAWWQELRGIIAAADGIRLLQLANPVFLSFRPFPGGATRAQTGQLGFRIEGEKVVPALITTRSFETQHVVPASVRWPLAAALASVDA